MRRRSAILGASLVLALVSLSGGSASSAGSATVPRGAVARVGDSLVTRTTFDRWFQVRRDDDVPRHRVRDYRPPRFAGCVAKARRARAASRRRATTARLRTDCRIEYEAQRDAVLDFLITRIWQEGEATELGIAPTAGEHEAAFQRAKRDSFASESEFRAYLRHNGMTVADARLMQQSGLLAEKLNEAALATVAPVTDLDVAAFLDANPGALKSPELRAARIILTATRADATRARRALERGRIWRHVARRYAADSRFGTEGLPATRLAREGVERALGDALFRAPRGALRGPVKGALGFYVFKVLTITPPADRPRAEVEPEIRQYLTLERQREAIDASERALQAKWKPRTTCRDGFEMFRCSGVPDPPT